MRVSAVDRTLSAAQQFQEVVVVDFAALPPEVNSSRVYAGAGAGPLVAVASAWDGLAAELGAAVRSFQAVISELIGGSWLGPSSQALAAAAGQFVTWLSDTGAQAEQTANQARLAVAAYEAAFAATVPPPLIAANRALLALLVATNILGQNAPAIASTEAQYAQYWAQDTGAMYTYAAHAAAATTLPSFNEPQDNTNPTGVSAQAAAVSQATSTSAASNTSNILSQLLSAVPNALQQLSSFAFDPNAWLQGLVTDVENFLSTPVALDLNYLIYNLGDDLSAMSGPWFLACVFPELLSPLFALAMPAAEAASAVSAVTPVGALGSALADSVAPQVGAVGSAGLGGAQVSAGLGEAASVAGLSVPRGWATAAPEIRLAAASLPAAGLGAVPEAAAAGAGSWFGGVPVMGNVLSASRGGGADSRPGSDRNRSRQTAGQRGVDEEGPGWWRQPERRSSPAVSDDALSERERDELSQLRKEISDLAMERDAAARLIKEAIQK